MSKTKFKLFYSPNTLIYHDNNTISHFIKKRFIYGFYMWPILTKLNLQNYYFFLPLIFVIFLISFPLIFIINHYLLLYSIMISIYFFIVLLEAVRLSKNLKIFFYVLFVLVCGNISPGFGEFFGFFDFIKNKVQLTK